MPEQPEVQFTIRRASPADNLLLADLGRQTFYDSFAAENTPEDMAAYLEASFSPTIQADELADPHSVFLIAEAGGETVGFARLKQGQPPDCITGNHPIEIVRFYAVKAWIGRGVGAALMQACLDEAARRGCDSIWLDVWERNPRAVAFYHKWGFAQVGEQSFKLGDDIQHDLLMQRTLSHLSVRARRRITSPMLLVQPVVPLLPNCWRARWQKKKMNYKTKLLGMISSRVIRQGIGMMLAITCAIATS